LSSNNQKDEHIKALKSLTDALLVSINLERKINSKLKEKLDRINNLIKDAEDKKWYWDNVGFQPNNFLEDLRKVLDS